jgi:PAS domain S-box-containing protein
MTEPDSREALHSAALDRVSDAIVGLNSDLEYTFANSRAEELLGETEESLLGTNITDSFPAVPAAVAEVTDAIETGEEQAFERYDKTRDRWFEVRVYPDGDGASVFFTDVSERKERRVGERREGLRELFDGAPDPMFVQDEDGNFTDVNKKAAEKLGYSREELLEMEAADLDATVDRTDARELLSIVKSNGQTIEIEGRHQRADGSTYPVDVRVTPLETEGNARFLSHARDITERKEREQRLEKLQERLNVAVEGAEIGTWDWNIDTDEVIFNDAWATMLGYTRDELDFHFDAWEKLVHPADLEGVTAAIEANMAGETDFWEAEIRMETESGDWKWIWTIGRVVERDGDRNPVRAGGIHIDIDDRKQAEFDLKRSERQFDAVFNDPQLLVVVLDTEGVVQRINETALDSAPVTREQTEGTLFSEMPWWTHDETVRNDIQKRVAQAANGEYVEFEAEAHVTDGERMVVIGSFRPVTDADGEVVSVVASGRDVTERKEQRQELERKQKFLEQTQEVATVGGWEVDLRTNSLRWTEEVYRIHGLGADFEPTVEKAIDLYHPEDQATIQDAVETATTEGEPYDEEVRIVRPGGEVRWTRARGEPMYEDGEIVGVRGTFQDITERKEREQELKRHRNVIQAVDDGVYALDETGHFELVNDAMSDLTGYDTEELLGKHTNCIKSDEVVERAESAVRSMVVGDREEDAATLELEIQRTGDGEFPAEDNMTLLWDDDGERFEGTAGVIRNITERKEREQELQRQNSRLDEFASVVSHDLRNPLDVALGRAAILREESGDEYRDHIAEIVTALERMESIISDTLTLARQGETVSDMSVIQVRDLMRECWAGVETSGATLEIGGEFRIRGDRDRLRHVFENLFRNAVEHGGEDTTVRVGRAGEDCLYVEDDGPGIPPDERDTVIEPGHTSATGGTGFGLTIVKRIAEAHGWEVTITDGQDGGARFEFDTAGLPSG